MVNYAIVKDDPSLKRDMQSGVLVGVPEELEVYRKNKAKLIAERDKDRKIRELESEVKDIKSLLVEILDRLPQKA